MKNYLLYGLVFSTVFSCKDDDEPALNCKMSASVNSDTLCYEDSRYLIAYASVIGEPSVFSLSTPIVAKGDQGQHRIVVETTEFTGPGTYTIRKYNGGSERSTYGYLFDLDATKKTMIEYNSTSGVLVIESVTRIEGTSDGLATGTFTMIAGDDQGNSVKVEGAFRELRGMGWWED